MTDQVSRLTEALQGRYDIQHELGAGGMATVYLAHDVRHDRDVAVKVLHPDLGAALGSERFLTEIRTTAKLQHPHILPLLDSGEANGLLYYVMPFVQGESLRDRLAKEQQLPIPAAISIAREVADALTAAHEAGIVHRDIKPENILLRGNHAAVADFGIALAVQQAGGHRMTQTGLSLGTPQYMSPEQAMGEKNVGPRSDIYSLGAVTYEMITGEPPFTGNTVQAIVAKVMTERPIPLSTIRNTVPPNIEAAVLTALAKTPADRFTTAAEFAGALAGTITVQTAPVIQAGKTSKLSTLVPWGIAAAALLLAIAGWSIRSRDSDNRSPVRFMLSLADQSAVVQITGSPFAFSADGKTVAYVGIRRAGGSSLSVRALSDLIPRELPETDNAIQPAFSPDGKWIAFYGNTQLRKIAVDGGTSIKLADLPNVSGISWGAADEIITSVDGAIVAVPAVGGAPRVIARVDSASGESAKRWPLALADGKTVLYTSFAAAGTTGAKIGVLTLDDGNTRLTDIVGSNPLAIIEGYLIYADVSVGLMGVKFDTRSGKSEGEPVPVLPGALIGGGGAFKGAMSRSGSVLYLEGNTKTQLTLVGNGAERALRPNEDLYAFPRFSPDGKKIAMAIGPSVGRDIWIYEIASGTMEKVTNAGTINERPEWSPDGSRVLYRSNRDSMDAMWWQRTDMSDDPAILQKPDKNAGVWEAVISPDGKSMIVRIDAPVTGRREDLFYRSLSGDTTLKPFVASRFLETAPRFSPDGKWVAFTSNQSGSSQVYVTPFPGPGGRNLVSTGSGAVTPVWTRDGRHIVYATGSQLVEATLTFEPTFSVVSRRIVYEGPFATISIHANFDVAPSHNEYLVLKNQFDNSQVIMIHDWKYELLSRLHNR